ncbi:MAG: tRNA pseudouridine(13) synthase TruD [Planctomycetes bacterium]|nr:tRNA pseudouridine(13) synthase TruD [Planctomycetota bacterium]
MSDGLNHLPPMPRLTDDLPGTGGRLRAGMDDFEVTELPLYEPSGQGTHSYLWIEKRGIATMEMVHRLARTLGRDARDFGTAGLKDARAVTRQWVSIEHVDDGRLEGLSGDGWRVLRVSRHGNKLKIGHLRGNEFAITIRDVPPDAAARVRAVVDRLCEVGVPNLFGHQRFGLRGDSHLVGRAIVAGQWREVCDVLLGRPSENDPPKGRQFRKLYDAGRYQGARAVLPSGHREHIAVLDTLIRTRGDFGRAARAMPKNMRRFFVSAWQSALFNEVVAQRMPELGRLMVGDLAWLHDRGAVFTVEDVEAEQLRADRLEISPSGPLFGGRMKSPLGRPGEIEREVLAASGLSEQVLARNKTLRGGRRPMRVPLVGAEVEETSRGIRVKFALPAGTYATVVMDEIMKCGGAATEDAGNEIAGEDDEV